MQVTSKKIDPKVKDILLLLGAGIFIAASIVMPGLPLLAKPYMDKKEEEEKNEWKKFNTWRLKQVMKRLYEQKFVEITYKNGSPVVEISEKGKQKLLKYELETMQLRQAKWDRKWRIIMYDIFSTKKREQRLFRKMLKQLRFFRLQKSVYMTAFPCADEIEYLRQLCNIGKEVVILTVSGIENEQAYKEYFGIS